MGECVEPDAGTGSTTDTGEATMFESGSESAASSSSSSSSGSGFNSSSAGTDGTCPALEASGPVEVTADNQVIEGLRITADGEPGILVQNHRGVIIRDCEIHHLDGPGIEFAAADDLWIDNVIIVHDRADIGPHEHLDQANIKGNSSGGLVIERTRVTRGSSGIQLAGTPSAVLRMIEGHDIRGPGPPASFISVTASDEVLIEDFSCINPLDTGRAESLIELRESSNVTVRRGLLDGSNAEFGYGVLFIQTAGQQTGGLVEDVDVIRMTNGGFSGFPSAYELIFRRTRARENICEIVSVPIPDCGSELGPNGGCPPGSGGRTWAGSPAVTGLIIEESAYFDVCSPPVWPESAFSTCDGDSASLPEGDCGLTQEDFELRPAIEIQPCWEAR